MENLDRSVSRDLGDYFQYQLAPGEELPIDAGPVRAYRFGVEARLARRTFERFHLDVGIGDPLVAPAQDLPASGLLEFAEGPTVRFRVVSIEQHFAEKIHALTRPHGERENTRTHDLADLMLLMDLGLPERAVVREAVSAVFDFYRIQPVPAQLGDPPAAWVAKYSVFAAELSLNERSVAEAMARLRVYWRELGW